MRCPVDQFPLSVVEPVADGCGWCQKCGGMWVPYRSLQKLKQVGSRTNQGALLPTSADKTACPVDGSLLSSVQLHGVEAAYCKECKGVWIKYGQGIALNPPKQLEQRREINPGPGVPDPNDVVWFDMITQVGFDVIDAVTSLIDLS